MNFRRTARRTGTLASLAIASGLALAAPSQANHQTVYGLTTEDPSRIVSFAVGAPGAATGPTAITGLTAAGDNLIGIDYRPRSNTLYGEADNGQLYTIAPPSGMVTTFTATPLDLATDPADVDTGFDFNPVPDRLRVNNTADENFRINVDNGVTTMDTALNYAVGDTNTGDDPAVGAAAYTNNFDGATATTLYDIEALNNALVTQNPPNNGTLNTVGTLPGGDITSVAGFDIETQTGNAYAALQTTAATGSVFYRLDLATGAALNTFGTIAGGQLIEGIALPPIPQLAFANTVTSTREGGAATVTVSRQGPLNQQATVNYATELAAGDTAQAADFTASTGTLTFAPGDAQESLSVPTTGDTADEGDETFTVRLSAPSTSVNLPAVPTSKVNVLDDDVAFGKPGAPPLGLISVPTQKIDRTIRVRFICDDPCTARLALRLRGKVLDRATAKQAGFGAQRVTFDLSAREVRRVKRDAEGRRSARLSAGGVFSDADGTSRIGVRFQLG